MMDKKADKEPITREAIERLLRMREKIIGETGGQIMEDSAEVVRQAREERTRELISRESKGQYIMDQQEQSSTIQEINIGERKHRPITREAIKGLRRIREEILRERNGELFEDSAALIDEMRDLRTKQLMQAVTGQYEYDEELDGEQGLNGI